MRRPITEFAKDITALGNFLGEDFKDSIIFTGVTTSSKDVEPGDLFIALPGNKTHGGQYAKEALNAGAVGILTDSEGSKLSKVVIPTFEILDPRKIVGALASWFYSSPSQNLSVIGITGTNGKTTTATLLKQIFDYAGKHSGFIGTTGILLEKEKILNSFTTPEATDLQQLFALMRESHISNIAMEVSSIALEMNRLKGTKFTMAGFSNLTQDHLDYHGDMESYFQAKSKLFTSEYTDLGFINIDDLYGEKLLKISEIQNISLSRENPKAQWRFERIEQSTKGYSVAIRGTGGILIEGSVNLIGEHNLDNLLMAVAMAFHCEIDPLVIGNSLVQLQGAPGRLEGIDLGQKFLALVDYAHTPDAVKNTLSSLKKITAARLIGVLGCGGDRDKSKRAAMGQELINGCDVAIFTSDNPRSEDPEKILAEMTFGLEIKDPSAVIVNRREAIATAITLANPGDCVVLLGKGHELGQEILGVKHPFDDRLELARAIEELS